MAGGFAGIVAGPVTIDLGDGIGPGVFMFDLHDPAEGGAWILGGPCPGNGVNLAGAFLLREDVGASDEGGGSGRVLGGPSGDESLKSDFEIEGVLE